MKKRSRLSRALSILLAMLMILSNSAITTYADIIGGVSQQSAGSLEVEVQVTTDGTTIDTSHSGSIYMYLQGDNNHRILKKVDISNGVGSVSADQLYDQNGQNPSPVNPNADYTITFFEYTGNSQLQENQNYEHVQQHEKKKVGIGDYTLGDCKLITIPSSVRSGTKATVVMKAMGKTEASYSAIDSNLGVANDFGAFVKTLSIGADVEATLAANTVVSLGHSYNFSDNNYKAVNNKIIITKTFTDKDGKPKANASITLKLYRDKELVGTQTVTTGSDGKATAEFQHLLYGNYTFYEVINNEEIKVDGKTEEGINVTYTGNAGIIIENRGFSNYSYFNNVEVSGNDLDHARGGFIVLDNAYEAHKNDNMTNARIEKAGENEFPQIDFDTYFSTTLPNVSKSIAAMKSSSDVQVYYVKASELKHDMDISSNGNKYIIMNVDMSDVGSAFTLPGQYKIDGTAIQANFENQKESQILWNFYDYNTDKVYEGTITQGSKMTGIILAPKCTVNGAPGNLGGTVIADTYNHTTGEIHGVRPYVESQIKNAAVKNSEKETKEAVANIYVKKTFADGDATQKFNFVLTTKNNAPVPANGTKLSISQSDGIKSFGEIKYTQAGTYTYTITEKNDGAAGVTYDGNTWTVTVNVPEDFSTPTVTYVKDKNTTNTTGAEFVNTYTEQKGNLSIKKVAGANTNLEGKTFYFKVTGPDNYSEVKELVYGNGKDSITISDLKPGDYTVTEVTDSKGTTEVKGNQSFPYQVSGDGKITVKAGQTPEISVTNTSVLGKIKVTKKVIGKENSKDKFYVALFKADKKTKVDNQPVKEITAGQTVTFENLVPGTYYVFETDEDGNKLNDTVVNGYIIPKDGTKTTIINDQKSTVPEVGVTLTNKWLETSLSLVGGKILTNITEDQAQKANFTFYVYKKGTNSNPVATGSYKAGKIEFTSISYDLKDLGGSSEKVFEYEIKEDIPSDAVNGVKNQIHYDTKIIPAAVTVELSSEELKITKVEVNGKEITSSSGIYDFSSVVAFENYIANGTDAVVSVIKRINNGYVTSCDKKFRFTLNKADNETNSGYTDPQFNTPFTSSSVEITGAGRAEFAKIYFNKVGYYRYTLTEDNLAATGYEGYQKDSSIYNVTIHVEGINNKQLTATVFYQKNGEDSYEAEFNNTYTDTEAEIEFTAKKVLPERNLKDKEFKFEVKDADGKVVSEGSNDVTGKITFNNKLQITLGQMQGGEEKGNIITKDFTYTVSEKDGKDTAIKYDTPKSITVHASYDKFTGKLSLSLDDDAKDVIFTNHYDTKAEIAFTAKKVLPERNLKDKEFKFEIKDADGKVVSKGSNDADGNINFDKAIQITLADMKDGEGYAESRDFIYTVTEVKGNAEGVTYDSEEKTVKIHAAYDPAEGKLTLSLADDSQPIEFTNRYHAAGQLVINGIKYVNGEELNAAQKKVLAGNVEFKLERAEVTDGQTGEFKEIQTAALTEEGTFSFKTQNYTEKNAGKTYVYQISESKADVAGFDIDSTVYSYTVSVGDNGDGTLNITALDGNGKHVTSPITVTFNNEYHASGQAQLNGTKTLLGSRSGDIKEGEFTFQVLDEDGNEVTTGKTLAADETGKAQIAFEPISYTEKNAGKTYTYTVQETAGEDKNITYDTTIYVVTVKVSDNLDGTLETEVTYPEGFENGLTFTNSYKASGAATLKTTKTLEGRTAALAANEFVFSLYEVAADGTRTPVLDKDGNPMRAFNDAEGNVIFGEISYTQDDQGTHNYEIVEEAGNDSAVTYDKEPVKATVTVSDKDGSGVLNAEAVYEKDGHTSFRNEYHANGKITFTGLKKLTGKRAAKIKDGEFTFTVKDDATGETVATGKTKDGGVIEFTEISYTEKDKGEHTYTITEDKGSDSSITYSEESVKVTVNVTDSNNGSLEATATYPEGGATFTNAYNAAGEVVLKASKTLEGSTLAADQFSFELKDEQGNVLQTKKNDADGKVTFDSLKYTEKDIDKTYTYTVSEVNNDITGVTYDNDVYTVKVQITDSKDSNGTLNITETSEKDKDVVEEITFVNTFAGTVKLIKTSTEGRALPGAEFALYSKNDKGEYDLYTADNEKGLYTTDAKGQINVENLPADDYYFIETAAPDGYKIRKVDDGSDQKYSFKIGIEDGDAGIVENAKVNAELTVQNDINGTNSITVTKKITYIDPDTFDEFEMTWPKDQIFYVNLFTDPEGTIPYRTSTPKAFTVSENSSGTATFENVSKGTYYVFETDAEGNSIPMDEEMLDSNGKRYSATVDGDGTNQVELDVKTDAEEGKINLINRYFDMPGGAAYKGWINISKNILKGTDQIDVDDTFYAGIFTKTEDGEYDLYSVVTLANNNTVKTEVTLGGENGDQPITYYVYETDEQGNRIDQNEFAYTVTGEGEVSLDKSNTTADITITNTLNEQYSLLIRKVDENKDALAGAQFQITDGNGNVTDTWTSTLEDHPVVLEPGTYKLSELVAPDGYKPGSEVTITVDDEGGISIESEVDGEADFDEDEDGILDYINYPETTITPTATPSAKTTPTGNQTTSRTSVKTGDDTPIALYILLLAVAACAAGGAVTVSRKKRKNK